MSRHGNSAWPATRPPPEDDALVPDGLASQPTLSRLLQALSTPSNRKVLREGLAEAAIRRVVAMEDGPLDHVTLDIDSVGIEVHGNQEGAAYNGHLTSMSPVRKRDPLPRRSSEAQGRPPRDEV